MPSISIRKASVAEHPDIAALYERCGYSGGLSADDTILVALRTEALVGVVRLCSENQVAVLRGMQVLPDFQRQGIGRALLDESLCRVDDAACYCIPWSHLEQFYGSGGFERCESKNVPGFLAERFSLYAKQGRDVILMRRVVSK
jgi:N-acetylglutamate synthase-like GNAT family acetyltransferase